MSVINQMLKELEQRQSEQSADSSQVSSTQIQNKASTKIVIAIIIIVILVFNVAGLYIWRLYTENKALKNTVTKPIIQNTHHLNTSVSPKKNIDVDKAEKTLNNKQVQMFEQKRDINNVKNIEINNTKVKSIIDQVTPKIQINESAPLSPTEVVEQRNQNTTSNSQQAVKVFKTNPAILSPVFKTVTEKEATKVIPKPSLSISRSKLSPERAVKKKLEQAERAIIDNEILKAERLFEDILLIQPKHKDARKQLSALWFGRKLFQPALNLLSKGVNLFPYDVDFRLMKARVLLNQNTPQEAFNVLNGYATAQHIEYQVLLATTAQSIGNLESVILSYKQLINIEEHKGKWWLGLAVALDRDSQFDEARTTYKMALSIGNLSSNSTQFIKQRMIELGE